MVKFNFQKAIEGNDNYPIVAENLYPCEICYANYLFKGATHCLNIELRILNGSFQERMLRDKIFFAHPRKIKCVKHGIYRYTTLLKAIGIPEITNTEQLIGCRVFADVKLKKYISSTLYEFDANLIFKYLKIDPDNINPNQEFALPIKDTVFVSDHVDLADNIKPLTIDDEDSP